MIVPLILVCWMLVLFFTVALCRAARGGDRDERLASCGETGASVAIEQQDADPGRERAASGPVAPGQPALQPS